MNTYDRKDMSRLSFAQTDPLANLVQDAAFPPLQAMAEAGKFREVEARAHYLEVNADQVSKYTVGLEYDYGDAFRYYKNTPIGAFFKWSNADLSQPAEYGYLNQAAMIEDKRAWLTKLIRKKKEKALYTAVSTNGNFEGATYYADAATAWSSVGTSDPGSDVAAGRLIVPELNAGIMSYTAFLYCQRNTTIKASTTVAGARRDGAVDPTITTEFLKNYFQLDYLWIARGSLITDSATASDETRAEIWGDKMLLFYHNPTPSPMEPTWLKHLYWTPMNKGAGTGGWFVTESIDERPGGVGVHYWDIWNYHQFLSHEKSLAYRIDNVY
jgi:hypothetical protein